MEITITKHISDKSDAEEVLHKVGFWFIKNPKVPGTIDFDALEWLAAMSSHVPDKGEQMVR